MISYDVNKIILTLFCNYLVIDNLRLHFIRSTNCPGFINLD